MSRPNEMNERVPRRGERMRPRADGRKMTVTLRRTKLGTKLALVVSIAALTGVSMAPAGAAALLPHVRRGRGDDRRSARHPHLPQGR